MKQKLTDEEKQENFEKMQDAYPLAVECVVKFCQEAIDEGVWSEVPALERDLQRAVNIINHAE